MKYYFYILSCILISNFLNGQEVALVDSSKKDIFSDFYFSKKCVELINDKDFKQLKSISEKWNLKGSGEPSKRLQLLLDLNEKRFSEYSNKNLMEDLLIYRAVINGYTTHDTVYYLPYKMKSGYPSIDTNFNKATVDFSADLKKKYDENSIEAQLADYYTNHFDSLFIYMQNEENKKTTWGTQYKNYVTKIIKDTFNIKFGITSGIWSPTGNNKALGNHMSVGFQTGITGHKGWGLNISMNQRLKNLEDTLLFVFSDTLTRYSNRYFGGFYGLEISKNLYRSFVNEIDLFAGVALDGFNTTYDIPEKRRYVQKNINCVNYNFGIAYRYIIRQKYFTEVQFSYNILNYENKGGTDLSGNAITCNILIGIISGSRTRWEILRSLDYKF